MSHAQLDKLLEYIDAMFAALNARDSSDAGLIEMTRVSDLKMELRSMVAKENQP